MNSEIIVRLDPGRFDRPKLKGVVGVSAWSSYAAKRVKQRQAGLFFDPQQNPNQIQIALHFQTPNFS
jgi:hypothetical protein